MKNVSLRPSHAVLALALVCACATAALPSGTERGPLRRALPAVAPDAEARVIVKYKADSTLMRTLSASRGATAAPQLAASMSSRLGLSLSDGRGIGARAQVLTARGITSQELADRLAAQTDVEYAVVDGRKYALAAPNDPLYGPQTTTTPAAGQWYLRAPTGASIVNATTVVSSINAEAAWAITTGSAAVVVAVLDTGVRRDHPDLAPKLLAGYDFVSRTSISGDGNARDSDASDPGDFEGAGKSSWHGTQVSGLVGAASNNRIGMAGAGRDVMVLPVRVLGTGGGFDSDIQAGMLWAAGLSADPVPNPNPARVINLSLGSAGACSASYLDVVRQLNAAGAVVVAAAGNDGLAIGSPANCQGVSGGVSFGAIAVAGVRHAGTKVGYSDLGPEASIAAPAGNCVNSTGTCLFPLLTTSNSGINAATGDASGGSIYTGGDSNATLGTSFSAPLVSGTAALMLSVNPALTPAQVLAALQSTARNFPTAGAGAGVTACVAPAAGVTQAVECYCTTTTCGAGLLDAGAAVAGVAPGAAVANIDTVTSVLTGSSLALSAASSRSSTAGATIQTYAWTILAGGENATITGSANASTTTLLARQAGAVRIGLTVSDSTGKIATTLTTLTVAPPISANIAASESSVITGGSISLDGTASKASFGSVVSYEWSITGGTAASLVGSTSAPTVTLATNGAGTVTVNLNVRDSLGNTANSRQDLTVTNPPSSGGGGVSSAWLLAWLAATAAIGWTTRASRAG